MIFTFTLQSSAVSQAAYRPPLTTQVQD